MSNVSLSDLMRELQAGEEARARVPQLEASNNEIFRQLDATQAHNQQLELAIRGYKDTIDSLQSKVRSLEVERDDAGFRELEAIERLSSLLAAVRHSSRELLDTVADVDPPAPEPTPLPAVSDASVSVNVPIVDHGSERVADPTITNQTVSGTTASTVDTSITAQETVITQGQSDSRPTPVSTQAPDAGYVPQTGVGSGPSPDTYRPFGGTDAGPATPTTLPNAGKPWHAKPPETSIADWRASGGEY